MLEAFVAKRIEPLSSRAQIVAKASDPTSPPPATPVKTPPPRRSSMARRSRPAPPPKPKRSFWRILWITFQIGFLIFLIAGSVAGFFAYQKALEFYTKAEAVDLKKLDDLNVTSSFYDINGEELGRIFVEDRIVLKPDEIPKIMRQAVMAAEDRRFFQHGAIDYWGILRAVHENITKHGKAVQGGSTIEQQLSKHIIGDFSRTMDRKLLEAFVALRLERTLTKDQIMNYYLNRIYFGKGYFGVGAAARGYFGKEAKNLTVPECAMLAGIIRAPTSSSPRTDPAKAKMRRDLTLRQMMDEGWITRADYIKYLSVPISILPARPTGQQTFVMVAAIKEMEQILSIEGTEEMPQGLKVQTNIDLKIQRAIEEQMNLKLSEIETASGAAIVANKPLQGAAVVAEVDTGRVRAWVGGRDFSKNQYDHISMAHRENGALLQPLLYTLAFDRLNLTPASMINASYIDPTSTANTAELGLGNPLQDLSKWFLSVQDALALGNKAAATRVGLQLSAKGFADWLKQAGVDDKVPTDKPNIFNPDPMTLGDVSSLYQILANGGVKQKFKIIQSIRSKTGESLYDDTKPDKANAQPKTLLNGLNDEQMTLTLQNALRAGPARTLTRDYGFRSGIAGMPGYSEGYRDAWFVGYTPKLLAGVWVGYDDSRPIGGKDLAMKSAVPLWGEVMRQTVLRTDPGGIFPVPPQLNKVEIDRSTGALRGLAGLAPAPGDIFVYLKKEQVEAAGSVAAAAKAQGLQAPKQWSDWLTTMFQDGNETELTDAQMMGSENKRDLIPALAEYKMPGMRGEILSSDGVVYASTGSEKNLVLIWPAADEAATDEDILRWMKGRLADIEKVLSTTITISDADLLAQYRTQRYQPFMVMENLTAHQVASVKDAGLESKGFGFQTAPIRTYPRGPELAHVLGYLSRDQKRNTGKYLGGDVIYDRYKGATGLEFVMNSELLGKDGKFMVSTTSDGYARSAVVDAPAGYGNNVRLSIDSKIQAALEQAMAQSSKKMKAGVFMDVHTGDVVAMASHPTFDPNLFVPSIGADEWNILNGNTYNPLLNRAIHAQYPPGSGFKTVTSIAAMDAGVFDPNWVVHCTGYFDIGNIHMDLRTEHGDITFLEGFTHSYNTYFVTLGLKVGRDMLLDTARSLNFGSLTNIILPGEMPGMIPDNEYVKRIHNREFGPGDLVNTSIGQGDVLVTPLQMATFMATVANNGTVYRPRLVKQIEDRNGNVLKTTPVEVLRNVTFNEQWMPNLKEAMINVTEHGTATTVRRDAFKIAAKTGTAQVGTKAKRRQIAWLSGYYPADNPQYSFSVMIEGEFSDNHGDGEGDGLLGGREAGAIVRDTLDILYPVPGKKKKETAQNDDDDAPKPAAPKPPKPPKAAPAVVHTAATTTAP